MGKTLQSKNNKLTRRVRHARRNSILPFTERPSVNAPGQGQEKKADLNAAELFSLFTADIIQEKTVFTR